MGSQAKRAAEFLWYQRGRVPLLSVPIPWRLPYGGWFLAHGDAMGARVAGYRLARSGYEEPQWRFVERTLQPGSVFIDIGANQGFYTLLAARRVGADGRVIAFEPAPTERTKLLRNLRFNGIANTVVEERALSDREGTASFHLVLGHQGSWSSLHRPAGDVSARSRLVEVRTATLDAYLEERGIERVDMVKIDVEGGELNVLRGAERTLAERRPVVLCEVEERRTRQWGYEPRAIIGHLEARGYAWREVTGSGVLKPLPGQDAWHNLVALPQERLRERPETGTGARC